MENATRGSSNDGKGRGRRERDRRGQERTRRREILGCDGRTRRGNSDVLFWQRACWGGRAGWSCNKRGFEQLGLKGLALQGWAPGGHCLGGLGGRRCSGELAAGLLEGRWVGRCSVSTGTGWLPLIGRGRLCGQSAGRTGGNVAGVLEAGR